MTNANYKGGDLFVAFGEKRQNTNLFCRFLFLNNKYLLWYTQI